MDGVDAIPEEDRAELLAEIDKVVARNKIEVTPDLFEVAGGKRGLLLPVAVNLVAAALLAGGVFGLYTLFQQGDEVENGAQEIVGTIEARLIDEVRREAEAEVARKNEEIGAIEGRMTQIAAERNALEANMESEIADREEQLRAELEVEMEALRERLTAEGVSEADIAAELAQLEEERTAAFEAQLAAFRAEAEAERLAAEQRLRQLEDEARTNLERMNAERIALEAEMEAELTGTQQGLTAAQDEIARLTRRQEQEANIRSQVLGYYLAVEEAVLAEDADRAGGLIAELRNLLTSERYLAIPALAERQEAELFIVDALEELLAEEERRRAVEAEVAEAREAAREAADSVEEARRLAIEEAREEVRAAAEVERAEEEAARLAAEEAERLAAEAAAAELIQTAEGHLAGGRFPDAVSTYLNLLIQYPESPQTERVPAEVSRIVQSYRSEIDTLETEATRIAAFAEERSGLVGSLEEEREALRTRIAEMEAAQEARAAAAAAAGATDTANAADDDAANTDPDNADPGAEQAMEVAPDPELVAELERLRQVEATIEGLRSQYSAFAGNADPDVLATSDETRLLMAKRELDEFLTTEEASFLMPGLLERIRIYDRAFEDAGRRNALLDTVDLVSELASISDIGERRVFIESEMASLREPEMIEFLQTLEGLVE
jgi:hypothetical protein